MFSFLLTFFKVIKNPNFPKNPKEALRLGFSEAEKAFLKYAEKNPN